MTPTASPTPRKRRSAAVDNSASTSAPTEPNDVAFGAYDEPNDVETFGPDEGLRRLWPTAPTTAPSVPDVRFIALDELHESPLNARQRFDRHKLQELADSLLATGQITPLLVRPSTLVGKPGYEIGAGHRRRRAAEIAKLDGLLAVVRELSDREFLEVLTIENLQREDVHPLDEAHGYAELIKSAGYDVSKIADRIGKSSHYVRDRLKLLELIPPLQKLLLDGTITVGHAIPLSRLTSDDQARILGDEFESPLFTHEDAYRDPDQEDLDVDDLRKPISVRELATWIDKHIRFDPETADVPEFFPETAAVVQQAAETEEKIVKITHEHYVQPEARSEDERTIGPRSWKRADGKYDSPSCEHAVTGVVAIGPGRGEAFKVCIDKKRCKIHWASEQREAARRAKESSRVTNGSAEQRRENAELKRREEEQRREAKRQAWDKARPQIYAAIAARVKKLPAGAKGQLAPIIIDAVRGWDASRVRTAGDYVPLGTSAEDLVRHAAFMALMLEASRYSAHEEFPKVAKKLGIDLDKVLAPAKPDERPKAKAGKRAKRG